MDKTKQGSFLLWKLPIVKMWWNVTSITKESSASNCTNYQHQAPKVLKLSTLLNISRDGQTSGKVVRNFLVNTSEGKVDWTAATSSAAPVSASGAPDGLGLAFGGTND